MSKLPTAEQINVINANIDRGNLVAAIKTLRDITGLDLPTAKYIVELQSNRTRIDVDRAYVLAAYDGLWETFKSMHIYNEDLRRLGEDLKATAKALTDAEKDRDEYKSRLNAMRMTAGLPPLADSTKYADLLDEKLPQEAQQDGFYERDPEIATMSSMVDQLLDLNPEARCRVLDYLQRRFE
jgi:hypothetical protein